MARFQSEKKQEQVAQHIAHKLIKQKGRVGALQFLRAQVSLINMVAEEIKDMPADRHLEVVRTLYFDEALEPAFLFDPEDD